MLNSIGPRIDPCGTTSNISSHLLDLEPILILCLQDSHMPFKGPLISWLGPETCLMISTIIISAEDIVMHAGYCDPS